MTPTTASVERSGKRRPFAWRFDQRVQRGPFGGNGDAITLRRPPMLLSIHSWSTPSIAGSFRAIVS